MGAGVKCQAVAVCLDVWCGLGPKLFIDKTEKSHIGPSTCHFFRMEGVDKGDTQLKLNL